MTHFRKSGIALTLAFLVAAIPQQTQAFCCPPVAQPLWWQFWIAASPAPTMMNEAACIATGALSHSHYAAYALGAYLTYKGAKWAAKKADLSPKAQAAMAWAHSKVARAPKKVSLLSRVASKVAAMAKPLACVVQPFGDKPLYAPGYFKPANKNGKGFFTRTDADGNRFETDWCGRLKTTDRWSGQHYAQSSTAQTMHNRIAAIRARFGNGKAADALINASNFMNKHHWVSNAIYYPALAAAGYYGLKGAELAYEKIAEIWADYQAHDLLSEIIDKANELLDSSTVSSSRSALSDAMQQDAHLVAQISKMPMPRQVALRAAISLFDKAFTLQNQHERAIALNEAVDRISMVCNEA